VAVANVDIQVDARSALQQLKAVNTQALATAGGLQKLSADALRVKAAVEAQQGGFAKASQVQGVFAANVKNTEAAIQAQIKALRDVQSRVQIGGALYQKAATQIAQYQSILDKANRTEDQAQRSAGGLGAAVGKLAVAYIGLRTAQEAVQAGIQREESSRRLQFLAKGYGEIAAAQDAAARSGRAFGLSITESNQQFAQLYGRLRPLNVSLSDIEAAFVGFNTAAKVSGATSEEASGALRQLSQALGSGALRGDELNSVLEQAPGLVVALTKELNAPISQIRKLAEEGKITSDVVIRALKRAGTEGADELAAAMDGPAQAVKNLQNEFENLQVAATKDLLPSIIDGVRILTNTLKGIAPIIRGIGAVAGPVLNYINSLIEKATGIEQARFKATMMQRVGAARLERAGVGRTYSDAQGNVYSTITGRRVQAAQPVRSEAEANALQQQLLGRQVGGGGGGGGRSAADKAQRDRERAAEVAKQQQQAIAASQMQLSEARALYDIEGRILEARAAGNRELEVTRKAQTDLLRISFEAQLLQQNTELPAAQRKAQLDQLAVKAATISRQLEYDIIELGATRLDQIIQMAEGYSRNLTLTQQLTAEQQKQKDLADGIANTIGQGMASAFDGLIQGTEDFGASLRKIASGVLTDIANQLLRILVINQAINAISNLFGPKTGGFMPNVKFNPSAFNMPSLLPGRATGGSVTGGQPYLVGERGPELFMPGRSGGIAPSGSFGGDTTIVVNVDASGTKVQGNEPEGQALARIVAAAVNAELIKQKRPGGVLA
jgi:tape measure domain-containing protein